MITNITSGPEQVICKRNTVVEGVRGCPNNFKPNPLNILTKKDKNVLNKDLNSYMSVSMTKSRTKNQSSRRKDTSYSKSSNSEMNTNEILGLSSVNEGGSKKTISKGNKRLSTSISKSTDSQRHSSFNSLAKSNVRKTGIQRGSINQSKLKKIVERKTESDKKIQNHSKENGPAKINKPKLPAKNSKGKIQVNTKGSWSPKKKSKELRLQKENEENLIPGKNITLKNKKGSKPKAVISKNPKKEKKKSPNIPEIKIKKIKESKDLKNRKEEVNQSNQENKEIKW